MAYAQISLGAHIDALCVCVCVCVCVCMYGLKKEVVAHDHVCGKNVNGHDIHLKDSWQHFKWAIAHTWSSHGVHTNKSWRTYRCTVFCVCACVCVCMYDLKKEVLAHDYVCGKNVNGHDIHLKDSWQHFKWVIAHTWSSQVIHTNKSWRTYRCTVFCVCVCACVCVCVYGHGIRAKHGNISNGS